ncbi:DUF1574 family protein [Calothrix sp. 336/3]|uniref:DUF1574 family protein n=1 Tax=Calothrix sp. 336/3 TaxID=1337936 RepID=UPI0004E3DFF6|nr:DUF1574 family protein [Calothrix sp. 336/3]AKG20563.1 hypothetical protein IJ00_03845 [Calothrix sp. 336/3]
MKKDLPTRQQSLAQWVSQATGINTFGVKIHLRGNDLHILCEAQECPQRWQTLSDLLKALQQTDLDVLTNYEEPSIYQVFVYGRKKGEARPQWCHRVHLNQLDKHLQQVEQALLSGEQKSEDSLNGKGGALILSNESLAKKGDPEAIARYLSETLSTLGVAVKVKIKNQSSSQEEQKKRLWVFCQSAYTPDPSLIAEPVAQKLRYLELTGYDDAVLASMVEGETTPDWLLRIDLTPPQVMLKEWARWGDIQAIARLLSTTLADVQIHLTATLKESTLHLFCTPKAGSGEAPNQSLCVERILPQLEAIAPQGILATAIYGQKTTQDKQPVWVDWRSLPAHEHPSLAPTVLELCKQGDESALIFLLERVINPNIDIRLTTGGTRVLLLRRSDILHIMCDAPVCPSRKRVAPAIIKFLRQIKVPGIVGVRVYGRRAGNKEPFWQTGADFIKRQRLVPEASPEFAATAAYIGELLPLKQEEPIIRPEVTPVMVQRIVTETAKDWLSDVRNFFLRTQLFAENDQPLEPAFDAQSGVVAFVWGTLGLLLALQTDWILGQITAINNPPPPIARQTQPVKPENNSSVLLSSAAKEKFTQGGSYVFNASSFTRSDVSPARNQAVTTAMRLAARNQQSTFNARQLDEQLALYKQRLIQTGKTPDVLIIGSSRALRGIDPNALKTALKTQGFANVDIFNFGINGATAQVVDFLVRRILEPSELPKLIIWADGARAFNSGREDMTFKAIAASPGYQQALKRAISDKNPSASENTSSTPQTPNTPPINYYQVLDENLNQILSTLSPTYQQRQQVKNLLNHQLKSLVSFNSPSHKAITKIDAPATEQDIGDATVDFDGFLPLSIRFNPQTYYQKYAKVTGSYDNDYKSFQLNGIQDSATQALLQYTQSQNISLVFINMPLTDDYMDTIRSKHEQDFQKYMLALGSKSRLIYRDLNQLFPDKNEYFSDPSHLNRYGAYEVSQKIAKDPMIPWSNK